MRYWKRFGIYSSVLTGLTACAAGGYTYLTPNPTPSAPTAAITAMALPAEDWNQDALPVSVPKSVEKPSDAGKVASRGGDLLSTAVTAEQEHAAAQPDTSSHVTHSSSQHASESSAQSSDLYWLAHAIEAEAGGEPWNTKVAVGDVIMNRVHSPLYPNTVHGVLFQVVSGSYAFTCVQNGWINKSPSTESLNAAKAVLYRRDNIVPSALVFYNASKTPADSWVRTRPVICTLADMTFAK